MWCRSRQIPVQIPFSTLVVALYLFSLDQQLIGPPPPPPQWYWPMRRSNGYILSRLLTALILWTTAPAAGSMIECAKRTRSLPVSRKTSVDADVVKSIIDRFGAEGAPLKDLRIAAVTSLGFAGFFRFNELARIQPNHIFFHEEFVKVFVPKSKTDVYREGNYVYTRL